MIILSNLKFLFSFSEILTLQTTQDIDFSEYLRDLVLSTVDLENGLLVALVLLVGQHGSYSDSDAHVGRHLFQNC